MDHCHRPRVQDFLLIETRRLETKLIELVDKLDEENKATEAGKVRAAQQSQSEKKAYDFQLKTYCKAFELPAFRKFQKRY